MTKKIKKWGNSLAIRIPKKQADKLGLKENSEVLIEKNNDSLIIKPKNKKLKDMLEEVTEENSHSAEFPEDKPKGKEVW